MPNQPHAAAGAISPAQVKRLVAAHGLDTVLVVTPQRDKTITIAERYPVERQRLIPLKEAFAAEGFDLGPDAEDGSFTILGRRTPAPPLPDGLLSPDPVEQG